MLTCRLELNALVSSLIGMNAVVFYITYRAFRHGTMFDKIVASVGIAAVIVAAIVL